MDAGMGVGAAANVVGGLIQSVAASKAAKNMEKEFQHELNRQAKFSNEATTKFQGGLEGRSAETAEDQIDSGRKGRIASYDAILNAPFGIGSVGPTSADRAFLNLTGQSRAALGGYSDWQLDQLISNIRLNEELSRISNFAGGTASVFPYRMQDAQHSMDELAFLGQLVSSIGGSAGDWSKSFGGSGPPTGGGLLNNQSFQWGQTLDNEDLDFEGFLRGV